jgi:Ca2+-binding RTX toxin-like protein
LILTTGNQNLVGTSGGDLFVSDPALAANDSARLVEAGDTLNGAGGNDTLSLDAADVPPPPTGLVSAPAAQVQSIENLVIKSDNTNNYTYTLDADKVGGLQKIFWQGDSGDSLTINALDPAITTTLTKSINNLDLNNPGPTNNPVNLVLDGGVTIGGNLTTNNKVNQVNLESKGTGTNTVINTSALFNPTNYVITGSANLELDTAGLDAKIKNLDASAFTGNLNTKIDSTILSAGSFKGGSGNDTIDGSSVPATINLTLIGNAGNDILIGGAGDDNLVGGAGNDSLIGGGGADTIDGGAGNDSLIGGLGNDSLVGGAGNDTLDGGAGTDTLVGGDGDDILFDGTGANSLNGGKGFDVIVLSGGADTITLGAGDGGSGLQSITDNDNFVNNGDTFTFTGPIDIIINYATAVKLSVGGSGGNLLSQPYGNVLSVTTGYYIRGDYNDPNKTFTVNTATGLDTLVVVGDGTALKIGTTLYTNASYFVLSNFNGTPNIT